MIARGSGSGSRSGSGSGSVVKPIDERMRDVITAEVSHDILNATMVISGTVKEDIMEIMDERLRSFQSEIIGGQVGAPEFFRVRDPIII